MVKNKIKTRTKALKKSSPKKVTVRKHKSASKKVKLESDTNQQQFNKQELVVGFEEENDGFIEGDFGYAYLG